MVFNSFIQNPVTSIPGLVLWLNRDGIDSAATAQGNNVDDWTDVINSRVFNKVTGTQPTLDVVGGKREVQWAGTSAMSLAQFTEVDFVPRTDAYSIVCLVGNDEGASGTLIAQSDNGSSNMTYQLNYHSVTNGQIGANVGSVSSADHFNRWVPETPLTANKLVALCVGTADNDDVDLYYNSTTPTTLDFQQGPELIGTGHCEHPIFIGARRNDSDTSIGFQFEGSTAQYLIFNRKLTSAEVGILLDHIN